jgi:hypothetical protein
MMNEGELDVFRQIVCDMANALGVAINGDELDDLTLRTGHAGEL